MTARDLETAVIARMTPPEIAVATPARYWPDGALEHIREMVAQDRIIEDDEWAAMWAERKQRWAAEIEEAERHVPTAEERAGYERFVRETLERPR